MKYLVGLLLLTSVLFAKAQGNLNTPDFPGDIMIDIGLNYWDSADSLDQKGWPSKSIGFYYMKTKFLSEKFTFRYGAGFTFEKVSLGNRKTLRSLEDSVLVTDIPLDLTKVEIRKNKLATMYLDIPLELRFYPKGTDEGEGLFFGVGGVLGLRMNAYTKIKYGNADELIKVKESGKYNLAPFRYGLQARFGFKGVHLFYKQYFSNTFKDNVLGVNGGDLGYNPRMTTVGINITGF